MTYPTLWIFTLVQIDKHKLKQAKKIAVNTKNLTYQGLFLLFSSI